MESRLVDLEASGFRFTVEPELASYVRDVLAPVAATPETLPGAEVVKSNPARTVVRVASPAGTIYVKSHRLRSSFERAKHLFVPSKARSEWDAMRRLASARIAAPRALALGESHTGTFLDRSVFVSAEVPDAVVFARRMDELRATGSPEERRALFGRLAGLVHRLFQAGAHHRDLHVGNFLIAKDGSLVVLDLHAVSFASGPASARVRRACVAKVVLSLGTHGNDPEAARHGRDEARWFVEALSALDPTFSVAVLDELMRAARSLELRHQKSRDRRCLVPSKTFAVEGTRRRAVFRRRDVEPAAIEKVLDAPALSTIHRHARGRSTLDLVAAPPELEKITGTTLVRKRELYPTARSTLGALFAGTRVLRAWRAARALEVRGLPAPRVHALVIERTLGLVPRRATLLMEHVANATMAHRYLEEVLRDGRGAARATTRARREVARAIGALVGRLHERGLVHRDLAVQNILLRQAGDRFDLWLVDLDEVRVRSPSRRERLRALVQLADLPAWATRADRLRGFRTYLAAGGREVLAPELDELGERGLMKEITAALVARAEAKKRRLARRKKTGGPTPALDEAARLP